jgi:glycosyltransferase involved in cell wall biosynthesis
MRLAFVTTRFGLDVVGGAEVVAREAAEGFAARGHEVDVLTTCARDHYTWKNVYPPGEERVGGITVHRFPAERSPHSHLRNLIERRVQLGEEITADEELTWLNGLFLVPGLYHHLLVHGSRYDAVVLGPYLFWTTVAGAAVDPRRSIVMPQMHDESYARLTVFRPMMADSAAIWFMSEPEHQLAHRLGPVAARHAVTGQGVKVPTSYDPEGFRARHGLERPFVLFAGRRERGKGWDDLLHAFGEAVVRHRLPFDLVTLGVGAVHPPPALAGRVIDLGFLDDDERDNAYAAAAAYAQPSPMESFSRTIMEAWLAGTPVIASAASEVVGWHGERSGAGLTYDDVHGLVACLEFVAEAPDLARELARRGRQYVLDNYTWPVALDRMEASVGELAP